MLVDGKKIATDIAVETKKAVDRIGRSPLLVAVTCNPNFATTNYLKLKTKKAAAVGITLEIIELPAIADQAQAIAAIKAAALRADGVVVQLPFPPQFNREALLAAVPKDKDPDAFSYQGDGDILPPVVGAIKAIIDKHNIYLAGKKVVVLGRGRLVGAPAARFLEAAGAEVMVIEKPDTTNVEDLKCTDVIVSGIGQPHFVTAEMVKDGVVIFDAGTSEDGGFVVGDVDPLVASKASLFTPVPGGIGPITVAILLQNLLKLALK